MKKKASLLILGAFLLGWEVCLQANPERDKSNSKKLSEVLESKKARQEQNEARYRSALLFAHVLELVREEYVDEKAVDYKKLTYSALDGMLSKLDPYCEFMNPDRYDGMKTDTEGEFGGIGIYLGIQQKGALVVNMAIEGGPSFKAGLLPGDWIVKIDGVSTKGISLSEAVRRLRGLPGEAVTLLIYRPSTKESKEYEVVREVINIPTVRGVQLIAPKQSGGLKIGYIRITQFGEKTVSEFDKALNHLYGEGMTSLILDLRNNPGGLLDVAVQVAGKFLPNRSVVLSTEGRYGKSARSYYQARGKHHYLDTPICLLINRHSASGAEVVAGALKDLNRAVLIGQKTYGKGSVQTVQMVDGVDPPVGIRLTTAKYYTPSRNVIHGVGIRPHITVSVSQEEERLILRKQEQHVLPPEEQKEAGLIRDVQLERAISVLKGIEIFKKRRALTKKETRGER